MRARSGVQYVLQGAYPAGGMDSWTGGWSGTGAPAALGATFNVRQWRVCVCVFRRVCVGVRVLGVRVCAFACLRVCECVRVCVCLRVYIYMCVCVCVCVWGGGGGGVNGWVAGREGF